MSWRRFNTLIGGLSVNSATVNALRARHTIGSQANTMRTPEQAQRAFETMFGGRKTGRA